jgi:hypothetical protein
MKEANLEGLRAELALLEAQELLHHHVLENEFGYAGEAAVARERQRSDDWERYLHHRVDALRELLATLDRESGD